MADILSKSTNFPEALIPEFFNKVKGKSALAALCGQSPLPFNGVKEFTFTLDKDVDVVAENGAKTKGGGTISAVTIVPIKVEYGMRVSDEFDYAAEEVRLEYLRAFAEGFANKVASGFDVMAMHGWNPRTNSASSVIGTNHFDNMVDNIVTISVGSTPDENIEAAIALINEDDYDATGIAIAPAFKSALAAMTTGDGAKMYPELAWGNNPGRVNGIQLESAKALSRNSSLDRALVGDFENAFKWGIAKDMPIEIIRYGNPDNDETLGDLKGHNQIYLRGETYIGWGILDKNAFAYIKASA